VGIAAFDLQGSMNRVPLLLFCRNACQEAADVKSEQSWVVGALIRLISLWLLCLVAVSALAPRAAAQQYLFNQLSFGIGSDPRGVVTADFNNDGRPDLAVVNQGSDTVSILLGQTAGTFGAAVNFATGDGPYGIVAGDFNNDGNQDLAITNVFDNTVSILIGNGNGAFTLGSVLAVGELPVAIVAGDFNNNGNLDLAVANMVGNSISVLFGNGNGTFQSQVVVGLSGCTNSGGPVDCEPRAIVAGFFNSDNNLDLAVANNGGNSLSILLGSSSGTFTPQTTQPATGNQPFWIAAADLTGNGITDLVVANNFDSTVSVLMGNGNGTFQAQTVDNVGSAPDCVWASSLVPNGPVDIVTANEGANTISVLIGTGTGTFAAHQDYSTGDFPYSLASADFNGDGVPDFAISNTLSNTVTVLIGDGDGTFSERKTTNTGSGPEGVAVGNLNGDSNLDAAVADFSANSVQVLFGNGNGTFTTGPVLATGTGPSGIVIGDFNGDGIMDIATANNTASTVSIMLGTGGGNFASHVDFATGTGPMGLAAGDLNNDGPLDLVTANAGNNNNSPNTVSVLIGNGNGTFQTHQDFPVGQTPVAVAIADFSNNGDLDLAVANSVGNTISILMGNGTGAFPTPQTPFICGYEPQDIAVGDFNNDGIPDLATANGGGGSIAVLLGNGNGTFQNHVNFSVPGAEALALGNFNDDNNLDAIVTGSGGTASVLLGNGNGTFMAHVDYSMGAKPLSVATGVFDSAGGLDFIATSFSANSVAVFLNLPVISLYPPSFNFGTVGVGQMSSPQNLTIANTGVTPLGVSSLTTSANYTANAENCVTSLTPGASCTATITFAPTEGGMQTGTATVVDNAATSPQTLALTGIGQAPAVTLSPSSLSFGNVAVGSTSAPQTLTLTNSGSVAVQISSIVASPSPPYAETNNCGSSLGASSSCTITVTFAPTSSGLVNGTISVNDNGAGSPQTATLSGTGTQPGAQLNPTSLNFGDELITNTSPAQTVVLTNTGNATLTISSVTVSGPFLLSNKCSTTLAAGNSCDLLVAFKPTAIGPATGTLTVTDNAPGSPQTASLSGTGTVVELSPSSLTFGTVAVGQSSSPMSVTLTNKGTGGSLSITSITIGGTDPNDFTQTNNCGSSVAAGASCTINVTFTPTATGARSAQLQVSDNGGGSPQTVALSGTGGSAR